MEGLVAPTNPDSSSTKLEPLKKISAQGFFRDPVRTALCGLWMLTLVVASVVVGLMASSGTAGNGAVQHIPLDSAAKVSEARADQQAAARALALCQCYGEGFALRAGARNGVWGYDCYSSAQQKSESSLCAGKTLCSCHKLIGDQPFKFSPNYNNCWNGNTARSVCGGATTCDELLGDFEPDGKPVVGKGMCAAHLRDTNTSVARALGGGALNFVVIGDFGRRGMCCQRDVAKEMANAMGKMNPAAQAPGFVVNVGDSFYNYGILNETDGEVEASWRGVYITPHKQLRVPWWNTLGNHDYRGKVQAELNLHGKEPFWKLPRRYYNHTETSASGVSVLFVHIDTCPFVAKYRKAGHAMAMKSYDGPLANRSGMLGKNNTGGVMSQQVSSTASLDKQVAWFNRTLKSSNATWKVVVGHHSFYTSGQHNDEDKGVLVRRFMPAMREFNVSAYFSGHDHDMQHLSQRNTNVQFFVTGAGSKTRGMNKPVVGARWGSGLAGFTAVSANATQMNVQFLDYHGNWVYENWIRKKA